MRFKRSDIGAILVAALAPAMLSYIVFQGWGLLHLEGVPWIGMIAGNFAVGGGVIAYLMRYLSHKQTFEALAELTGLAFLAVLAMQFAETMGIPYEDIGSFVGNTESIGFTANTGGSRTTFATGKAVIDACEKVMAEVRSRAGKGWGVEADQVEWQGGELVCLSGDKAGERIDLALAMADVYSGEIDFNSDLQPGDHFRVLVERQTHQCLHTRHHHLAGAGGVLVVDPYVGRHVDSFAHHARQNSPETRAGVAEHPAKWGLQQHLVLSTHLCVASDAVDDIDRHIVAELQLDGRLTNLELAERVGLSPSPCLQRVKRA